MFPNAQLAFSATGRLSSLRRRRMCSEQSSKNEASYHKQLINNNKNDKLIIDMNTLKKETYIT